MGSIGFRHLVVTALQEARHCRAGPPCPHCAARVDEIVNAAQEAICTDGVHRYLSTSCLHEDDPGREPENLHSYCGSATGSNGNTQWAKTPASCKFCGAPCVCPRHGPEVPSA